MKISESVDDFISKYETYFGMVFEINKLIPKYIKIEGESRDLIIYTIELMTREVPVKFRKNTRVSILLADVYMNEALMVYSFMTSSKNKLPGDISKRYDSGGSIVSRRDYWKIGLSCEYYSTNIGLNIKLFDVPDLHLKYKLLDQYKFYLDDLKEAKNKVKNHIEAFKVPVEDKIYTADYLLDGGIRKDLFRFSNENLDLTYFFVQDWIFEEIVLSLFKKLRYSQVYGLRLFVNKKLLDFALEKNRATRKYAESSESISKFLVAPMMKRLSEI